MTRTAAADLTCEPLSNAEGLAALGWVLAAAGLPADDLAEPGRRFFRFRDESCAALGYAGLEDFDGGAVLLRSLVVADPARRGLGLGRAIAEAALARARGRRGCSPRTPPPSSPDSASPPSRARPRRRPCAALASSWPCAPPRPF